MLGFKQNLSYFASIALLD